MIRKLSLHTFLALAIFSMLQCQHSASDPTSQTTPPPTTTDDFFTAYYDVTSLPVSGDFEPGQSLGKVENLALEEISGIAEASALPRTLWVEEDSGNENKIYLIDTGGKFLGSFRMTSIDDRDWEDISIGPGPKPDTQYLYLAETGDNNKAYPTKSIYRFVEPTVDHTDTPFANEIATVDKITYQYPDGIKNAEAIFVDPATKDIYIVSKEGQAVVYVARYPQDLTKVFTVTKVGVLPITDVTSAAISKTGDEILIKNYTQIFYWKKSSGESIAHCLQQTPVRTSYQPEDKGEAIGWATDGSGYFTTSEGEGEPVYFYKRK